MADEPREADKLTPSVDMNILLPAFSVDTDKSMLGAQ
jgi:hypothetical protein